YLAAAGWPGDRPMNSVEYQTQKRWQRVLLSVAHLDASLPKVSFPDALQMLTRAAQSSLFAPESQDAPIQIVGAIESAGLSADAVWFAGADELAWPVTQQPNPLLPLHLQRALKMPRADLAADFEFASAVTRRICASAPRVFASFSRHQEEANLSASAAFAKLTWDERVRAEEMPQHPPEESAVETEAVLDRSHVAWKEDSSAGGAQVLKDQAACPFRAFASKRLRAQTLEEIEEGLGRRDRGNLVHSVMENFWNEVKNQEQLLSLTEHECLEILDRHIATALQEHSAPDEWTAAFLSAESDRLKRLLGGWLQLERGRSRFAVEAREQNLSTTIGPLKLALRIDRVDDTSAGKIILDYKTGKANIKDWQGDRPDQPQLPLYALNTQPLAAMGFGTINTKKTYIAGWQREDGVFFPPADERGKNMTQPLDQQIREWRKILTKLAEEFAAGEARVEPKDGLKTCRNCGLETLCRIAETQLLSSEDEVDE
ncbi:MAG TPA: PD-(D/E)XK nuclease family protein, partial [Acidobacteriaceae bacterium]|nr:PD-(D/E)XK nuclease family protein [Acidobacteriaceae bacterium]